MKKLLVFLAAMVLTTTALASSALAAIEVTGDAYVGYFSKYVWRGIDLSEGMPVVQGGVDLSAKGFTLSYWTNVATRNDDVDNDGILDFEGGEGTENDLVLNFATRWGRSPRSSSATFITCSTAMMTPTKCMPGRRSVQCCHRPSRFSTIGTKLMRTGSITRLP